MDCKEIIYKNNWAYPRGSLKEDLKRKSDNPSRPLLPLFFEQWRLSLFLAVVVVLTVRFLSCLYTFHILFVYETICSYFICWDTFAYSCQYSLFTNDPGDRVLIPGRVIPNTKKMVFDASLFNSLHYKVRINGKVEPLAVATSPIHWYNSYWKGSLRVTLDYGWPTYFTYMSKWAYLEFPFVSVLVNHEYTNSDIEPW